jgi:hypothetical protein
MAVVANFDVDVLTSSDERDHPSRVIDESELRSGISPQRSPPTRARDAPLIELANSEIPQGRCPRVNRGWRAPALCDSSERLALWTVSGTGFGSSFGPLSS